MLADVAIYYDKESMYDPTENGVHVAEAKGQAPHMSAVTGRGPHPASSTHSLRRRDQRQLGQTR